MANLTSNKIPKATGVTQIDDSSITDNGGVTIGSPAGGAKGVGTLNATGLYVNGNSVGVPLVRTVSGTTDTILVTDAGNAVRYTAGGAIAVDVPGGLGAAFTCLLLQIGAGAFTVTGTAGATVVNRQTQFASAGQSAQCSLFADAADHLIFGGDTA